MNSVVRRKPVSYWLGAAVAMCLGWYVITNEFFDGDDIHQLGGGYYTANYDVGTALHWHKDPDKFADAPILDKVYDTRRNDSYLVARAGTNLYFAFPLRASSLSEVQQNRIGPLSRANMSIKMAQLTGDSTLRQVGIF